MTFGDFIRSKRLARALTQREAAERSGLTPAQWNRIERSSSREGTKRLFRRSTLERVGKGLGLPAREVRQAFLAGITPSTDAVRETGDEAQKPIIPEGTNRPVGNASDAWIAYLKRRLEAISEDIDAHLMKIDELSAERGIIEELVRFLGN